MEAISSQLTYLILKNRCLLKPDLKSLPITSQKEKWLSVSFLLLLFVSNLLRFLSHKNICDQIPHKKKKKEKKKRKKKRTLGLLLIETKEKGKYDKY